MSISQFTCQSKLSKLSKLNERHFETQASKIYNGSIIKQVNHIFSFLFLVFLFSLSFLSLLEWREFSAPFSPLSLQPSLSPGTFCVEEEERIKTHSSPGEWVKEVRAAERYGPLLLKGSFQMCNAASGYFSTRTCAVE